MKKKKKDCPFLIIRRKKGGLKKDKPHSLVRKGP